MNLRYTYAPGHGAILATLAILQTAVASAIVLFALFVLEIELIWMIPIGFGTFVIAMIAGVKFVVLYQRFVKRMGVGDGFN